MLTPGIYPAAVTPFTPKGTLDLASVARLLARFEAEGCQGVVLAGTTGEGSGLSAVEKRDLVRAACSMAGNLQIVLGLATNSLPEAVWLAEQAARSGAVAVLVSPPPFYASAPAEGVFAWLKALLDASPLPVLLYHFPKKFGQGIELAWIERLATHSNFAGLKDSSGERANLAAFRAVVPSDKHLFTGCEPLLVESLGMGWSGSISGASNVLGRWMSAIYADFSEGNIPSAQAKLDLVKTGLEAIRNSPQPATHKAMLYRLNVLTHAAPRLPLLPVSEEPLLAQIRDLLGSTGIS